MGTWALLLALLGGDAPKGGGSLGTSINVTKQGRTQGWWVHGHLRWHCWAGMHARVVGPEEPPLVSPGGDVLKGAGSMGTSINITKQGCTQG